MSKRTRLFLIVSGSILAVGLGTGLVASYLGQQNVTIFGSAGQAELTYIPRDAGLVAFVNVRDVMDSELRRRFQDARPGARAGNDFEARTGINVETDVDLAVTSLAGGDARDGRPLVLARGRFDEARIEGLIRERGGVVEEYGGTRLLTMIDDDQTLGVAFMEPGLVAFGTADAVRRSIDTKSSGASVASDDEVMRLVRDVDGGNAWAVGRFDAIAGGGRLPDAVASQLPPIAWFAATGRINGGVQGLVQAETASEQAADDLREVIRGFMALVRLQTRQTAELSAMLNSLELGGDGRTVSLRFSVPPEVIDALARMPRRQPTPPDLPDRPFF